jgi:hypothetical protein
MYGCKVLRMTLSRVLTGCVRRDRVMSKTLTLFIKSNSESSTKLCFLFYQQSAHCIVFCLCASPIFAFLQTVVKYRLVSLCRFFFFYFSVYGILVTYK